MIFYDYKNADFLDKINVFAVFIGYFQNGASINDMLANNKAKILCLCGFAHFRCTLLSLIEHDSL